MIELRNLTRVYDGEEEAVVHALNGVNLSVRSGEMVAVMGASGSGKSTLLNIIGCLDKRTRGEYLLNGRAVDDFNSSELARIRNSTFGYVMQDFAIIEDWNVFENVTIPLAYSKDKKIKAANVDELLEKLGIYEKKYTLARKLSDGQRQRTAIARALVNNPQIILADEPTGALDKNTGLEVMKILSNVNRQGKTVIIVTHDLDIARMCNRIVYITDGMITKEEIFR